MADREFVYLGIGVCLDVDEWRRREVVEGMGKRQSLGDDFAKRKGGNFPVFEL